MKHYQPKLNEEGDMIALSPSYVDLKKENEKLKFENKFLKKKRLIDLGMYPKEKSNDSTLKWFQKPTKRRRILWPSKRFVSSVVYQKAATIDGKWLLRWILKSENVKIKGIFR